MQIYINSERYLSTAQELSAEDIVKMAGYPFADNYKIVDEKSNKSYYKKDEILLSNNMSLVIKLEN